MRRNYSLFQAAARPRVSEAIVYRLCVERKLPHVRIACGRGGIRILQSELGDFTQGGDEGGGFTMKPLTVGEAAERLGVSESLVYRLCEDRKLPHVRIGCGRGTIRILESDLDEFIQSCRVGQFSLEQVESL
jgi:excisionase family DNA binding protein